MRISLSLSLKNIHHRFEKYAIRKAEGRGKSRDGDGKWAETPGEMDRKCALLPANAKAEECHSRRRLGSAYGGRFINPSLDLGCIIVSSGSRDIINARTMLIRWH